MKHCNYSVIPLIMLGSGCSSAHDDFDYFSLFKSTLLIMSYPNVLYLIAITIFIMKFICFVNDLILKHYCMLNLVDRFIIPFKKYFLFVEVL